MTSQRTFITALSVVAGVLGIFATQAVCGASPAPSENMTLSPGGSGGGMIIGVGVHRDRPDFDAERSDELVRQFGFTSIRDEIGQSADNAPGGLERSLMRGGRFSSPRNSGNAPNLYAVTGGGAAQFAHGIPLNNAELGSFDNFLGRLAGRIGTDRPIFEIWNEWNLPTRLRKAGTPDSYSALVRSAIPALRNAFPRSTILAGSIGNDFTKSLGATSYWDWTRDYLAGGSWKQADGLSVHLYANCMAGTARQPMSLIQRLTELDGMVRADNGGRSFPVYVTEVGWPQQSGACGFTQAERTAFPAQFLLMAEALPFVRGVWLYELTDSRGDPRDIENTFGLATADYAAKPSSCATAETIALLKTYRVTGVKIAGGVATASLQSAGGGISVTWSADGNAHRVSLPAGARAQPLCSTQDVNTGPLDLTILPQIIYTGAPPVAPVLQ